MYKILIPILSIALLAGCPGPKAVDITTLGTTEFSQMQEVMRTDTVVKQAQSISELRGVGPLKHVTDATKMKSAFAGRKQPLNNVVFIGPGGADSNERVKELITLLAADMPENGVQKVARLDAKNLFAKLAAYPKVTNQDYLNYLKKSWLPTHKDNLVVIDDLPSLVFAEKKGLFSTQNPVDLHDVIDVFLNGPAEVLFEVSEAQYDEHFSQFAGSKAFKIVRFTPYKTNQVYEWLKTQVKDNEVDGIGVEDKTLEDVAKLTRAFHVAGGGLSGAKVLLEKAVSISDSSSSTSVTENELYQAVSMLPVGAQNDISLDFPEIAAQKIPTKSFFAIDDRLKTSGDYANFAKVDFQAESTKNKLIDDIRDIQEKIGAVKDVLSLLSGASVETIAEGLRKLDTGLGLIEDQAKDQIKFINEDLVEGLLTTQKEMLDVVKTSLENNNQFLAKDITDALNAMSDASILIEREIVAEKTHLRTEVRRELKMLSKDLRELKKKVVAADTSVLDQAEAISKVKRDTQALTQATYALGRSVDANKDTVVAVTETLEANVKAFNTKMANIIAKLDDGVWGGKKGEIAQQLHNLEGYVNSIAVSSDRMLQASGAAFSFGLLASQNIDSTNELLDELSKQTDINSKDLVELVEAQNKLADKYAKLAKKYDSKELKYIDQKASFEDNAGMLTDLLKIWDGMKTLIFETIKVVEVNPDSISKLLNQLKNGIDTTYRQAKTLLSDESLEIVRLINLHRTNLVGTINEKEDAMLVELSSSFDSMNAARNAVFGIQLKEALEDDTEAKLSAVDSELKANTEAWRKFLKESEATISQLKAGSATATSEVRETVNALHHNMVNEWQQFTGFHEKSISSAMKALDEQFNLATNSLRLADTRMTSLNTTAVAIANDRKADLEEAKRIAAEAKATGGMAEVAFVLGLAEKIGSPEFFELQAAYVETYNAQKMLENASKRTAESVVQIGDLNRQLLAALGQFSDAEILASDSNRDDKISDDEVADWKKNHLANIAYLTGELVEAMETAKPATPAVHADDDKEGSSDGSPDDVEPAPVPEFSPVNVFEKLATSVNHETCNTKMEKNVYQTGETVYMKCIASDGEESQGLPYCGSIRNLNGQKQISNTGVDGKVLQSVGIDYSPLSRLQNYEKTQEQIVIPFSEGDFFHVCEPTPFAVD